ncbi:MAG: 3-deoxy-8-phosphooctulonate synthase [Gemmatimonadota bacterium]|nr:3-deoxy-8-phosphooctulonate synthase [Gemmatimonadota bacterium]MDH3422946.1 3-deoxy-8-phosphooctulonate synthase [Gemmatimonadota bacterium]
MLDRFMLIAGPCVLEDDALNLVVARSLSALAREFELPVIFKASFDKANRAKLGSPRGPGLAEGLKLLAAVKDATQLSILTDVHEPAQAAAAAEVVDVLQIPAFLCRQTDLLVAAGATGLPVNVKKGQWMAPEEMAGAVDKLRRSGAAEVTVTERGTALGYGDLVVDMRSFRRLRAATDARAIFDATHSVQRSGRDAGSSGGDPDHIPALARAASAAGCDGLYVEVHPDPTRAPSDGSTMLRLDALPALMRDVLAIRAALAPSAETPA